MIPLQAPRGAHRRPRGPSLGYELEPRITSVGKNRDTLEGFFSVVSEQICAIKEVLEALFRLEKISKTPSGGSLGKKLIDFSV